MTTPPAGTAPVQQIATDIQEAGQLVGEADAALGTLVSALGAARVLYDTAVNDAHLAYLKVISKVHGTATDAAPEQGPTG